MTKKKTLVLWFLIGMSLTSAYFLYIYNQSNVIPPKTFVGELNIGGLSRIEAKKQLEEWAEVREEGSLTCKYQDLQWTLPIRTINIDTDETMDKIFEHLDKGNLINKYLQSKSHKNTPVNFPIVIKFNESIFSDKILQINEEIKIEPQDAFFDFDDNTVTIVEEKAGIMLDELKFRENISKAIEKGDNIVYVPTQIWKAEKTKETLEDLGIKSKYVEFSTTFNSSQKNRTENIKLSSKILSGQLLAPGDVFSFNDIVGERSEEKGYKEAPIFVENTVVPGIGGGICQVSSTLYNLALLADLEIVERVNHSLPVGYVPLGRDATVDYNSIDFKFRNTTDKYLLLQVFVKENTLTARFYSSESLNKSVNLHTETINTIPPPVTVKKDFNLAKGNVRIQQGNPGYQVKLWKIYGNNEERTLISTDNYSPTPSVLYVGEKEAQVEVEAPQEEEDLQETSMDEISSEDEDSIYQE